MSILASFKHLQDSAEYNLNLHTVTKLIFNFYIMYRFIWTHSYLLSVFALYLGVENVKKTDENILTRTIYNIATTKFRYDQLSVNTSKLKPQNNKIPNHHAENNNTQHLQQHLLISCTHNSSLLPSRSIKTWHLWAQSLNCLMLTTFH